MPNSVHSLSISGRRGPTALYERAQAFIHDHLRDPDLSIDQIFHGVGL